MQVGEWTALAQGALGIAIAAGVAVIGYRQWQTARDQLKLDLFDRRLELFDKVNQAYFLMMRHGQATHEAFRLVYQASTRARFLFNDDVGGRLDELASLASRSANGKLAIDEARGEERAELRGQQRATMDTLLTGMEAIRSKMAPFLRLKH